MHNIVNSLCSVLGIRDLAELDNKGLKAHRNKYLYVWQHKFELHHKSKNKTFYARVYKLLKNSSFLVPKKSNYLIALAFELINFNLCSVIKIFAAKQMGETMRKEA